MAEETSEGGRAVSGPGSGDTGVSGGSTEPSPRAGCWRRLAAASLLGAGVLLGGTLVGGAWRVSSWWSPPAPTPAPTASVVVRPTPHFAAAVRDLAELATAEQTLGRVIDVSERQSSWGTLGFTVEDKLLYVAHGRVRAGVDLASLREEDFTVDTARRRVRVVLPAPVILSRNLDSQQSYVYARSKDWLATRTEGLEDRARQEAEATLERAAIEAGILGQARRNARTVVSTLIRQLDFDVVEVVFRDEMGTDAREHLGSIPPASARPSAAP